MRRKSSLGLISVPRSRSFGLVFSPVAGCLFFAGSLQRPGPRRVGGAHLPPIQLIARNPICSNLALASSQVPVRTVSTSPPESIARSILHLVS